MSLFLKIKICLFLGAPTIGAPALGASSLGASALDTPALGDQTDTAQKLSGQKLKTQKDKDPQIELSSEKWTTKFQGEDPPFELLRRDEKPFWRKSRRLLERLEDRDVLVSVKSDEFDVQRGEKNIEMKRLNLNGAGLVNANMLASRLEVKKFQQLKKLAPDHFVEIRESKTEPVVFVHGVAMGWHARMHLVIHEEIVSPERSRLHFLIRRGSFRGMKGFVELKSYAENSSKVLETSSATSHQNLEFSMTAIYESEKLPLPSFLLSFGLEAVMKVVAKKLRKHLEEIGAEYTKQRVE